MDQEYIRRDAIISHLKVVYLISTMHEMMVSLTGFGLKAFGLGRHPSFVGGSRYGQGGLVYTMEVYHRCAITVHPQVNHIYSEVCEVPGAPCHGVQDRARVQP